VTGGSGTNRWSVTNGALPQGVTLAAATGVLSGFPRQSGTFSYTATAVSCTQTQSRSFTFSIAVPTLTSADVVAQILGPTAPLNADQLRYLDFQGNNNGSFDVGDFLAWSRRRARRSGRKESGHEAQGCFAAAALAAVLVWADLRQRRRAGGGNPECAADVPNSGGDSAIAFTIIGPAPLTTATPGAGLRLFAQPLTGTSTRSS